MEDTEFHKLAEVLREALTYDGADRPALVARIPVICNDIRTIKDDLRGMKDNLTWFVRIIVGAVILALIALVLK